MYNDKMMYAHFRLIEEMFNDDLYRLSAQGRLEEIDSLTASSIIGGFLPDLHSVCPSD